MTADTFILKQCRFDCKVGCTPEERATTQLIILDIQLYFDMKPSAATDDLNDTIDYREAHAAVKNLIEGNEFNLIETMAESIAELLLEQFPIEKVFVHLEKPAPMLKRGGAWAGIEILRP